MDEVKKGEIPGQASSGISKDGSKSYSVNTIVLQVPDNCDTSEGGSRL